MWNYAILKPSDNLPNHVPTTSVITRGGVCVWVCMCMGWLLQVWQRRQQGRWSALGARFIVKVIDYCMFSFMIVYDCIGTSTAMICDRFTQTLTPAKFAAHAEYLWIPPPSAWEGGPIRTVGNPRFHPVWVGGMISLSNYFLCLKLKGDLEYWCTSSTRVELNWRWANPVKCGASVIRRFEIIVLISQARICILWLVCL